MQFKSCKQFIAQRTFKMSTHCMYTVRRKFSASYMYGARQINRIDTLTKLYTNFLMPKFCNRGKMSLMITSLGQ